MEAAARMLAQVRRSLYLILAGEPESADAPASSTDPEPDSAVESDDDV